jgi:hypothetical protein
MNPLLTLGLRLFCPLAVSGMTHDVALWLASSREHVSRLLYEAARVRTSFLFVANVVPLHG